jgi:hypothetical protein
MNWKVILFIAAVAYGSYQHFNKANPNQFVLGYSAEGAVQINGYHITPLEPFEMQARVLSAKHYTHDKESDLVPVD